MMAAVLLSTSALASKYYELEEVGEIETDVLPIESLDLEYLPQATSMGSASIAYDVGTSYNQYFAGLVRKLPYGVNYVYWRESRYVYCLAYGRNLALSGTNFRADSCDIITYNRDPGPDEIPTWVHSSVRNFSLSAGSVLVWSNLGHYPALDDGGNIYAQATLVLLVIFGLFYFVNRIMWRRFG